MTLQAGWEGPRDGVEVMSVAGGVQCKKLNLYLPENETNRYCLIDTVQKYEVKYQEKYLEEIKLVVFQRAGTRSAMGRATTVTNFLILYFLNYVPALV